MSVSARLPSSRRPTDANGTTLADPKPSNRVPSLAAVGFVVAAAAAALSTSGPASAFEDLNAAQSLVYDTAHLADTAVGDELVYRYRGSAGGRAAEPDRAVLVVEGAPDDERRDVTLDFLQGDRHLELPPFSGYRGNPVIIATLEHVAQNVANAVGGGALYVRNRIRDALAREDADIETGTATRGDDEIDTTTLLVSPFAGDAFLGARPGYGDATIRIVFSDDVPGGVVSIAARSGDSAASADDAATFDYELRLDDSSEETRP